MNPRPVTVIQITNQRLFSTRAADLYLGISADSMRAYADEGLIPARRLKRRRVFTVEDLDTFIDGLPEYRTYE